MQQVCKCGAFFNTLWCVVYGTMYTRLIGADGRIEPPAADVQQVFKDSYTMYWFINRGVVFTRRRCLRAIGDWRLWVVSA